MYYSLVHHATYTLFVHPSKLHISAAYVLRIFSTACSGSERYCSTEDRCDARRLADYPPGQVCTEDMANTIITFSCRKSDHTLPTTSYKRHIMQTFRYDHHTRLLPYVLNAIADEAKVSSGKESICCHVINVYVDICVSHALRVSIFPCKLQTT